MRIYHNQLSNNLINAASQMPQLVWLIFGDEPWQKNNALAQVKQHGLQMGYQEVIQFAVDDKFSWQDVINEYQAMSLFASQRIIEIEFLTAKIGEPASKALLELSENLHQDVLLIIHGNKLDSATTNKKWFKNISKQGVYLPLYDFDAKGLTMWLNRQARHYQLNLSPPATQLLVELFEGNVLALDQELQKLAILFDQSSNTQQIDLDDVAPLVINQAKFNPFLLIDTLLQADLSKCLKIIDQLQQEGTPITKIIWFVHKELKLLQTLLQGVEQGQTFAELAKQHRIWDKRKPLYQTALSKTSLTHVSNAIYRLIDTDVISKSSSEFNPFVLLADVCVSLYHSDKTQALSLAID